MWFTEKRCNIEFICAEEKGKNVIPEPYPARKLIPDWYKKLTNYTENDEGMEIPTLKRCPPFLDAMSTGWIIPLAADVTFKVVDNGRGVSWKSDFFHGNIIEHHNIKQLSTHPNYPTIPLKFINHWLIRTPPGWSCLFTMPLNRPDDTIELMSGIVETDKHQEYINFPGFLKAREGTFTMNRGHPLMQVIPFKRNFDKTAVVRTMNKNDMDKLRHEQSMRSSWASLYRDKFWEKK
jgi:hypothetical protein